MEMLPTYQNQLLLTASALCFLAGLFITWMILKPRSTDSEDPRNHAIRELDADLRAAERRADENQEALDNKEAELAVAIETMQELRATLADRDLDVERLDAELREEGLKTRELRRELQDRATERLREHVRAKEAETELEVARAGSEAVMGEVNRLKEEHENMTETMRQFAVDRSGE